MLLLLPFWWLCGLALAQTDTLRLNYEEAQKMLLKENLQLLSSYYDISLAEADLVQAKLWTNPYLVWNQDLYSMEKNQYFNETNQRLIQFNQTFSVAGKYTNTVKLAKINVELNKLMLQDVLRCLLYELGTKFLNLNALQQKNTLYTNTLAKSEQLIKSAENKYRVGAMPLNELTRLKSERIAVQTEAIHNRNDILVEMTDLKNLLNVSNGVYVQVADYQPDMAASALNTEALITDALLNRTDYLLSKKQIQYEERDLKLQKSIAMPDIMLGYQPNDKGSNYVRPYQGLVLEMNVPLFNRNQGGIQRAKVKIDQAKSQNQFAELKIRNEVQQSYDKLFNSRQGFEAFSATFLQTIEDLNRNSINNYDKKNINLLEYIDLQRIYIQNRLQFIDLQNEYLNAINQLNFSVGKQIIK